MKIIRFISTVSKRLASSSPVRAVLRKPPPITIPALTAPPVSNANDEPQAPQPSTSEAPSPQRPLRKRALLIGIQNYSESATKPTCTPLSPIPKVKAKLKEKYRQLRDPNTLRGCHKDVVDIKAALVDLYGYQESDITVMMDNDEPQRILPTRDNIIERINEFVADVESGDSLFFFFAGHSTQEDTESRAEEDGKDELIVTWDNQTIKDDELRMYLVDSLPAGCKLTAIFDSCHSASLLDLEHFRCNRTYIPWINKGKRRSFTKWNPIVRRAAVPVSPRVSPRVDNMRRIRRSRRITPGTPARWKQSSIDQILDSARATPAPTPGQSQGTDPRVLPPLQTSGLMRTPTPNEVFWLDQDGTPLMVCASPEAIYCTGWCSPNPNSETDFPLVISLSAAKDGQQAWEDASGASMTQALIKILRSDPHPSLKDLLKLISHDLHDNYLSLHARARDYKKRARAYNLKRRAEGKPEKTTKEVEMDNFQDPQISSLYPLNMNQSWSP
ncbi:hypothetical protein FA15DRAFT_697885 [Coprinopsis marcescibilis]|uniref:Peptidase C14 caspase domain-containing protein n=1 Tax=Coprinopsis marcescibilis TaxID=230819 RepID=A0A5C3KG65_COPMA|nr:hypothetical protein FA15DRAFT_697885 [Coprinopsis marcescibilis]